MQNSKLKALLSYAAIGANVIFNLWILFNAMDEGFKATLIEKASALAIITLLSLNTYLLVTKENQLS